MTLKTIEKQHEELSGYFAQIGILLSNRTEDTTIVKLLTLVIKLLRNHYKSEEKIMESLVGYPSIEEHKEAHITVLNDLIYLKKQLEIDINTLAFVYAKVLADWNNHEVTLDKELMDILSKRRKK